MTIKQVNNIITEAEGLQILTQSYAEIASIRLIKIRKQVEHTRGVFTDLAKLYGLVRLVGKQTLPPQKNLPAGRQETISILLTSKLRFNGYLNNLITKFFISQTNTFKTDKIVIGQKFPSPFKSFIFQKDLPSEQEIQQLVQEVQNYEQILIFYTQFQTVLKQIPQITDITQTQFAAYKAQIETKKKLMIVEPEIKKILLFFDTNIKTALLQGTFLEAELSRLATRLIAMDEAGQRATDYLNQQRLLLSNAKRAYDNKKMLETWAEVQFAQTKW